MSDTFRKEYKPISDEVKSDIANIKDKADELLAVIGSSGKETFDGRCRSLAITNLEQAVMWAVKAIT